jgi:hypothetical protein
MSHPRNLTPFEFKHISCIRPPLADHGRIIGTNEFLGIFRPLSLGPSIAAGIQ